MKILVFALALVFVVLCYIATRRYNVISVMSKIDGRYYNVRNTKNKEKAADTLAIINQRLTKLIDYLSDNVNSEFAQPIKLMRIRYRSSNIAENLEDADTSFTINKKHVSFCLKTRDDKEDVYDINTLTFVALHELAHIASVSEGHNEEFSRNFQFLKETAIKIKIYQEIDYNAHPVEYCGMTINVM